MFDHVENAPPDAILGLAESFARDPNPDKINLSVGVYQDETGQTPMLESVQEAEQRVVSQPSGMGYLGITGTPQYAGAVQKLILGSDHEVIASGRGATSHTPGGTGALRVAADLIKRVFPKARIWFSQPTWPNHPNVFQAAGLETKSYPYFEAESNGLAFDAMLKALQDIPAGDVVLLHGCCHNPTGIDPNPQQWSQIADVIHDRGLLPLLDFAYQGLAAGIREDAASLHALSRPGAELMVCSSFSKNFSLYRQRVGALTIVAGDRAKVDAVQSQVKVCIRANYSNPPSHGAAIVTTILSDDQLKSLWERDVRQIRNRINDMRKLLIERLVAQGVHRDFSYMTRQRGMFSFSGLTPEQVDTLRETNSIYIVRSGRINVAGITEKNVDSLCSAIAAVL